MPPLSVPKTTRELLVASTSLIAIGYAALRLIKALNDKSNYKKGPEQIGCRVDAGTASDNTWPEFDVIIVGGGTSGCVLASRISEDPKLNVLLLEAGVSGKANLESVLPSGFIYLFHSKHDYDFYTVAQPNAGGKERYWPRARLLGGCSSINAMMFHIGAPSDYDEWVKGSQEGSSGWSFEEFKKYFLKFEKFVPSKAFPKVNEALRGTDGPVQVGYFGYFSNFSKKWIAACEKLGIPFSPDVNTATGPLGATKIMTYMDSKGRRVSTETAYLTPDVRKRPNLTVAINSTVTKVIFETREGRKRAVGVEIARGKDSSRYQVRSKMEIILSAGAVHTPQILMLSGIGPAAHLSSLSIPIIQDLPGVGQHLMDHPCVHVRYRVKHGESLNYLGKPNLGTLYAALQWLIMGKGPMTSNISEVVAFVRSMDPKVFPKQEYPDDVEDSTSGSNAPDLELISGPFAWSEHAHGYVPPGDLASIGAVLLRPTSTGSITLRSADPFDKPIIDPNYLATKHDVDVLVRGIKLCMRIAQTEPLVDLVDSTETDPFLDHTLRESGEAAIEAEVRKRLETLYHPTSTARMASVEEQGVVDAYLRVHGVDGLRVADASVFPTITSGHTVRFCILYTMPTI